jgi:hypothetical protein
MMMMRMRKADDADENEEDMTDEECNMYRAHNSGDNLDHPKFQHNQPTLNETTKRNTN